MEKRRVYEESGKKTRVYGKKEFVHIYKMFFQFYFMIKRFLPRYDEHAGLHYRKLLWHGVNVACVAAILKYGLRITQFSGGSLGKGLYFTPEHAKSSWNGKLVVFLLPT